MGEISSDKQSRYLEYLPVIFRGDEETGVFLDNFLKIFEKLLSGVKDGLLLEGDAIPLEGIEEIIQRIYEFFDPERAPSDFLKWLAGWTALVLRDDWEERKKRRLIDRIISLYRIRGTKKGLEEFLKIYVAEGNVKITEVLAPIQIGVTSTIGKDTFIDGGPPHYFYVTVILPEPKLELKQQREEAVRAIIDQEKPAHTYYHLDTTVPTLQIEVFSTIGKDTLLGDIP